MATADHPASNSIAGTNPAVRTAAMDGALAYRSVLSRAGGTEVETVTRSSDRTAISIGLYSSPPYDLQVPGLPVSRLSITLTPSRVSGVVDGDRWRVHDTPRHALFLTPANTSAHWCKESPSRHLNIYFHTDAFHSDELGHGADLWSGAPILNASLPGSQPLLDALTEELERPGRFSAEASDSLARLLLIRLARNHIRRAGARERLSPADLAKLRDYVMAHLGERILVADLAQVIGLSPNHFAHVFSNSSGRSPHQFVIELRLEMAKDLLSHSRLGLAEIAAACGFSSQQHMTATMHRHLGITPGRFRGSRLPARRPC